jgi:DNA polymerase
MSILHLDFETYAHRDLKKVGVFEYVECPHFEVTVLAWAFDAGPVKSVVWPNTAVLPEDIRAHIVNDGKIHAWNATFERVVLGTFYGVPPEVDQMVCTMQRALVHGLPAALGVAGPALGLSIVKDVTAERLMKLMSKPRKDGTAYHREATVTAQLRLGELRRYCERDVEAEREIGKHIPGLTAFETEVSRIDALSNARGVAVDEAAVQTLITAQAWVKSKIHVEAYALTGGKVIKVESDVQKLVEWINAQGVDMSSVVL